MPQTSAYLEDIPLQEARLRWIEALKHVGRYSPLEGETVPLSESLNRVTAKPVWAKLSAPHYHAAAMDGYALDAETTEGATDTAAVALRVPNHAVYVNTGDPLPLWANAVVPIEDVQTLGDPLASIEIRYSTSPWRHVRAMGEDMVATELVLPANHNLRPVDIGAIAASGHSHVSVRRKPRVAVLPTGTELVPIGSDVKPGDILEYNSLVIAGQVDQWGGQATRWEIIPDDHQAIEAAVLNAIKDHDLIVINAGSSRGSEDFTASVVQKLGNLLVHGIAVRPGHPVILGMIQTQSESNQSTTTIPVIGVPGYPVSSALTCEIFVKPLLACWLGQKPRRAPAVTATLTRKVHSPIGDDEFMRVTVGKVGERVVATPQARGAGVISSLVRADGIVRIPRFSEGMHAGQEVRVHLYRSQFDIERTIVAIGSHDLTLDLLSQFMAQCGHGIRLASANVGSLGGLIALRRGECHIAGAHLLDSESGEYNTSYVRQYLPDTPVRLVTLVGREQGLIVSNGNPKNIETLSSLARRDILYVNRQRGAGTRLLFDYELRKLNISPLKVRGYDRTEYTHMAVAAAVASGVADCGMGIRAAASALDLEFLPLATERYDIVIPQNYASSKLIEPLLDLLHNKEFRSTVKALPGYSVAEMGNIAAEIG